MIQTHKATITRKNLKSGQYLSEKIIVIKEEGIDYDADSRYYSPAVSLLEKMFEELKN
ncbi:hypothetical protein HPY28_19350 [Brevibacillus sp. HB1.2]|uniref:hypothetical protein n=1 Tax=Brevibacillus sp. HB1.2 TaxID=2738807 RepID=UPI00157571BA|nr:hypothetical protein [Brevibacillus sp. HB1.2]NTU22482.1 hypothetical protein [Brevibacillus sp. HB1.2]